MIGGQLGMSFPLLLGVLVLLVATLLLLTPAPSSLTGRGRKD
jgi:hypothetical protein